MTAWQVVVRKSVELIDEDLSVRLSIPDIATTVGMSESHLRRVFRLLVGESLGDYVRRRRLEKAAMALVYSRRPITEIALDVGFESSAVFSRAFRRFFGKSPRHFRKENLGYELREGELVPSLDEELENLDVAVRQFPKWVMAYIVHVGVESYGKVVPSAIKLLAWAKRRGVFDPSVSQFVVRSYDDGDVTPISQTRFDFGILIPYQVQSEGAIAVTEIPAGKFATCQFEGTESEHNRVWSRFAFGWMYRNGYDLPELSAFDFLDFDFNLLRNAKSLAHRVASKDWSYRTEMRVRVRSGEFTFLCNGETDYEKNRFCKVF